MIPLDRFLDVFKATRGEPEFEFTFSGRSEVWNIERPSGGEGEGDGRDASRRTSASFGEQKVCRHLRS